MHKIFYTQHANVAGGEAVSIKSSMLVLKQT